MRKTLFFVYTLVALFSVRIANAQYQWLKGGGSTISVSPLTDPQEGTYFSCTDLHGNVYALNLIGNGAMSADTFYRPSAYGVGVNILFTSYTCNGQMRFAKLISGARVVPQGIQSDTLGHIYLAMDLPHGSSGITILHIGYDTTITALTNSREALIEYDTSGNLQWLRFVGNDAPASYWQIGDIGMRSL